MLELRTNNLRAVLDDDEISTMSNDYAVDIASGGGKAPLIINESGLYSLILRSRKPEAKEFKDVYNGTRILDDDERGCV